MSAPRRLLPSMSALSAFEAAAKTGSFSGAAAETHLSQSAISRQITSLEQALGQPLFRHTGRTVVLTDAGQRYATQVSAALDSIREATAAMLVDTGKHLLRIATLPGFGMRWLAPRLPSLLARNPELIVDFLSRTVPFDFKGESIDAAIHYGEPHWPGALCDRLMGEKVMPVCAPAIAHHLQKPSDVLNETLLHLNTRPLAWPEWLKRAGVPSHVRKRKFVFEQFMMLTEAAISGAGIALIPSFLIEQELASGALVCPFSCFLELNLAYYLVYPAGKRSNIAFVNFRDWLLSEAAVWEGRT